MRATASSRAAARYAVAMPARILLFPSRHGRSPCPACGAPRVSAPCPRGHADGRQQCSACAAEEIDCPSCDWEEIDGDQTLF